MSDGQPSSGSGISLKRALVIALVVVGLVLAAMAIVVWTGQDSEQLPFEYEAF